MSVAEPADGYQAAWEQRDTTYILPRRTPAQYDNEGRQQAAALQPLIPDNATVLDYGCGTGRVAKHITAGRVVGVDVNHRYLTEASRHIECHHTDGLTIPLPDNTFDFAYSLMVLQHCWRGDHKTIVGEIARVLKVGGSAYIQFPDETSGYYRDGPFVNVYGPNEVASYIPEGCDGTVQPGRLAGYRDGAHTDREHILQFTKVTVPAGT